jgi:hypothetical protein
MRPERWMVDYEHGEGEPQHAVLSWLDDEAKELPEVGTYLIREEDSPLAADLIRGAWQPSRVEVDAAEATIFEAFDDGTHGREADGYYRPLAVSVLVNAYRAKLTLARAVER